MILVAILGKSGSGKSTLEAALEKVGYNRMISYTTRDMREGEQNHREYHFINREQFQKLVDNGVIIEYAEYNGNLYGSARPIGTSKNVIVVEPDGLHKLKELYGNQVISIYMDIPDDEIERRLNIRGNTPDRKARKLADIKKFSGIKDNVDLVLYQSDTPNTAIIKITNFAIARGIV